MRQHRGAYYLPLQQPGERARRALAASSAGPAPPPTAARRRRRLLVLAAAAAAFLVLPIYYIWPAHTLSSTTPLPSAHPEDGWHELVPNPLPPFPPPALGQGNSNPNRPPGPPAPPSSHQALDPTDDDELLVDALDVPPLHHSAFPPKYATDAGLDLDHIYPNKNSNPHAGNIPPDLLQLLEDPPPTRPPPAPEPAPQVPSSLWTPHYWDPALNGSRTRFEDAAAPAKQSPRPDFRHGTLYSGWRMPAEQLGTVRDPLPPVQHPFPDPNKHGGGLASASRAETLAWRQRMVRNAFIRSWEGYKAHAWGHDELSPISNSSADPFNGWGATIVDALDTLLVMGLPRDYAYARQHVRDIDFTLVSGGRSAYGRADGRIPVFETAIRYLGGLLSAHDLSGDPLMLHRAEELAQLILPAFDTFSGVPLGRLKPGKPHEPAPAGSVVLAEAGSMLLEFTRLYQTTGNRTYFDVVHRASDWMANNVSASMSFDHGQDTRRTGTLLPTYLRPESHASWGAFSFGGMADSYYEYLIKEHALIGGRLDLYSTTYARAMEDAHKALLGGIKTVPDTPLLIPGLLRGPSSSLHPVLEHLACFSGGMLGLGARLLPSRAKRDMAAAQRITEACYWAYNSTVSGLGPEDVVFYRTDEADRFGRLPLLSTTTAAVHPGEVGVGAGAGAGAGTGATHGAPRGHPQVGVRHANSEYKGRPETIESVLYMYRLTGDTVWQERGWQMFASWVTHAMTESGFAQIRNVNTWPVYRTDTMESFVFAETFKYYFLLFSPPSLVSLDEYVFTTEAHPLLLPQRGRWARPGSDKTTFWRPAWADPAVAPTGRLHPAAAPDVDAAADAGSGASAGADPLGAYHGAGSGADSGERSGGVSNAAAVAAASHPYIGGEGGSPGGLTNVQKMALLQAARNKEYL